MFNQNLLNSDIHPIDSNAVWYSPEDDETISRQVYKRDITLTKLRVFRDDDAISEEPAIESADTHNADLQSKFANSMSLATIVAEENHGLARKSSGCSADSHHIDLSTMSAFTAQEKFPLQVPNPCNPYSFDIKYSIMSNTKPPLDCRLYLNLEETSNYCQIAKSLQSTFVPLQVQHENAMIVKRLIFQGGQGFIYHLCKQYDVEDEDSEDTEELALKISEKADGWEYYILYSLRQRLSIQSRESIVKPISCHLFSNETLLFTDFIPNGTLLEAVNRAHKCHFGAVGGGVDELVAMFWTLRLLQTVSAIHKNGIIHGDIKIGT
jgi:hypothetical protein